MTEKKRITFDSIGFELVSSTEKTRMNVKEETAFKICVLGDFSGRAGRGIVEPCKGRMPHLVDRDTIDEILEALKVNIRLDLAGEPFDIPVAGLDDFHPDHLFEQVEIFQSLNATRRKLSNPRTYNEGLKELRDLTGESRAEPNTEPARKATRPAEGILDQILLGETSAPAATRHEQDQLAAFLDAIVKPHLVPRSDPEQERLQAALDEYVAVLMRVLLHHPTFQAMEAAWRGLDFLVSRVETDELLKIYLLDISQAELEADVCANDDLSKTWLYHLLTEDAGDEPFTVLIGDFTIDHTDAGLLGRLARIAHATGAVFLAQAQTHLIGCDNLDQHPDPEAWRYLPDRETAQRWEALRRLPEAANIGLVIPRFLLRLPYGVRTDPIERFEFEEMEDTPRHADYLWGNGAFAAAYLLARSFSLYGWDMQGDAVREVENLPLHIYKVGTDTRVKPSTEVELHDRALEAIINEGLMPLTSGRATDTARMVRFQSIADPPARLNGRWERD